MQNVMNMYEKKKKKKRTEMLWNELRNKSTKQSKSKKIAIQLWFEVLKEPDHYVFIVKMSKHLIFNGQDENLSVHHTQFISPTTYSTIQQLNSTKKKNTIFFRKKII